MSVDETDPPPAAEGWTYRLNLEGREIDLSEGTTIVGRGRGATIRLEDDSVSRKHARITCEAGRASIEDLGSSNGTFLGDRRLAAPVRLLHGAVVRFGNLPATFELEAPVSMSSTSGERRCGECGATIGEGGQGCQACSPPGSSPDRSSVDSAPDPPRGVGATVVTNGRRGAAAAVDLLMVSAIGLFFFLPAVAVRFVQRALATGESGVAAGVGGLWLARGLVAAGLAVVVLYFAVSWRRRGATFGERLFGLKVVETKGAGRLGRGRAILRSAAFFGSVALAGIGLLPMLFGRRPFHDWISRTVVRSAGESDR